MYRETRIPRLRASLWVSVPDKADFLAEAGESDPRNPAFGSDAAHPPAPSLIVPDGCMDLIVIDSQILIADADSTARRFHGSAAPTVGLRFDSGVLRQLLTTSAGELADRVTPLDAVIGGSHASGGKVGEGGATSLTGAARVLLDTAGSLTCRASLDLRPIARARALDVRAKSPAHTVSKAAAAEVGYADAAHLRRDERSLIG